MLVSWWPAGPPLYPGQGPGDSTAVIPRTLLVKRTAAAVTSLGTVLAGGSTKAGQEVAGGVSRTLSLQGGPGLQDKLHQISAPHLAWCVVHSHWSRLNEAWLSLVESFIVLLRQCLLCHKEPARRIQNPLLVALERKRPLLGAGS